MKTAIISPIPLLDTFATLGDQYHLVLSHLVSSNSNYANYYKKRVEAGDFVILDNSAHEFGEGRHLDELTRVSRFLEPNEVVLPDRLFFGDDTLTNSFHALNVLRKTLPTQTRYMGVPQGRTFKEWVGCLAGLLEMGVDTIGLSKDYEVWDYSLLGLVYAIVGQAAGRGRTVQIHLLGWGRQLWELQTLSHVPEIRGVDSAKPLVYGFAGIALPFSMDKENCPEYPKRSDFFSMTKDQVDGNIRTALHNIDVFKQLAGSSKMSGMSTIGATPSSGNGREGWTASSGGSSGTNGSSSGEAVRGKIGESAPSDA